MTALPANLAANVVLARWIEIGPVDTITLRTGKVEIGQGILTALAAIAATELCVATNQIRFASTDTMTAPDEGYTSGSLSVEQGGGALRMASAMVRELFRQRAGALLGCAPGELGVANGIFAQPGGDNEGVSYWQMRDAVALDRLATDLPLPVLIGGTADGPDYRRLDLPQKLSGAGFIQDLRPPRLAYGRVLRPAHPCDRLTAVDRTDALAGPGILAVVVDGGFCGVVAERDEQALAAIAVLRAGASWRRTGELPAMGRANAWMDGMPKRSAVLMQDQGAAAPSARRHAATYTRPYIAHASIGPSCAVAHWTGGRLAVQTHSQSVHPLRRQLAVALGVPVGAVDVTHVHGAGCYGHNGADDVALDAALLARAVDRPVMCQWTRADEFGWSPFGAPMRIALQASLSGEGTITSWQAEVTSPPHVGRPGAGDGVNLLAAWDLAQPLAPPPLDDLALPQGGGTRNIVPIYSVGQRRLVHHLLPQQPLRTSALRSLGAHGNVFAIESFMDELAALAGADPVAFRLRHCDDPRARRVITAAAEAVRWDAAAAGGEGHGRGIGFGRYKGSGAYYAVVAEVEVGTRVRLVRCTGAVDAGPVVHRNGLLNQIEGGVVQAASWALLEQAGWNVDGFAVRAWPDYPILPFSQTPAIETIVIDDADAVSVGVGECVAGPLAAAIANAVSHALGLRVRDLPLTPECLAAAIHAA
ncbi:MAG: molybdopterin cofactor-binding domain-containing protein [Hyphomicrobiaceae bacterium]